MQHDCSTGAHKFAADSECVLPLSERRYGLANQFLEKEESFWAMLANANFLNRLS